VIGCAYFKIKPAFESGQRFTRAFKGGGRRPLLIRADSKGGGEGCMGERELGGTKLERNVFHGRKKVTRRRDNSNGTVSSGKATRRRTKERDHGGMSTTLSLRSHRRAGKTRRSVQSENGRGKKSVQKGGVPKKRRRTRQKEEGGATLLLHWGRTYLVGRNVRGFKGYGEETEEKVRKDEGKTYGVIRGLAL